MKHDSFQPLRDRLEQLGLRQLASLVLDVMEPFSPFAAQILWVAQPTLGIFMDRERVGNWASLLEDTQGYDQLRDALLEDENPDE
jgi:hypothetical protein